MDKSRVKIDVKSKGRAAWAWLGDRGWLFTIEEGILRCTSHTTGSLASKDFMAVRALVEEELDKAIEEVSKIEYGPASDVECIFYYSGRKVQFLCSKPLHHKIFWSDLRVVVIDERLGIGLEPLRELAPKEWNKLRKAALVRFHDERKRAVARKERERQQPRLAFAR